MANDRKLEEDQLVQKLVPDPAQGPPDATVLRGYLGRAPQPAGKGNDTDTTWRLYQSPALDEYVEISEADILHTQKLPDDQGTIVWVPKSLQLQHVRVHSTQVQAEMLGSGTIAQGSLTAMAAHTAGGVSPRISIGTICSTIGCPSSAQLCPSQHHIICRSHIMVCGGSRKAIGFASEHCHFPSATCPIPSANHSYCMLCPIPSVGPSQCTNICPAPVAFSGFCPPTLFAQSFCTVCAPTERWPTPTPTTDTFGCTPSFTVICPTGGSPGEKTE